MELKPCPFCGGEATMTSGYTKDGDAKAIITCTHIRLARYLSQRSKNENNE